VRATLAITLVLLGSLPQASARAAPVTACHCFTNRTFDPQQPAAADPYILATARSSVLSAAFSVPKAGLVQEVMSGAQPDDLWIAYWAGARIGRDPGDLMTALGRKGSWKTVFEEGGAARLSGPFRAALARGGSTGELAAVAVDDVLATRLAADRSVLAALRKAGASSPEAILSTLLSPRLRAPPTGVLARFQSGKVSWGMLLDEAGVKPKEIDGVVRRAMR
jgi:hypothetical protein